MLIGLIISAVSLIHCYVSLQDFFQWSQQSLEHLSVQHCYLEVSLSNDVGSSWLILEESQFTEVVATLVLHDDLRRSLPRHGLSGNCLPFNDQEEGVTIVTLLDHVVIRFEGGLLDSISKLRSLIKVHGLEKLD